MSEYDFHDHAKDVLAADSTLSDEQKADLWETWHDAKTPQELSERLNGVPVPADVAQALLVAKQRTMPEEPHAMRAIRHMATLDPAQLDLAENHPGVLQTLLDAIRGKK